MTLSFFKTILGVIVIQQIAMFRLMISSRRGSVRWMAQAFSSRTTTTTTLKLQQQIPAAATTAAFRPYHTTSWARNSAVEEDLDSALEDILGDAFAAEPSSTPNGAETAATATVAAVRVGRRRLAPQMYA